MIRISVVSSKGGVGKSTIIYFLSRLLATEYNILIVDLSSSLTLSNLFGIKGNFIDCEIEYSSEKDKVDILSFSEKCSKINLRGEFKDKLLEKYQEAIKGKDIVFVEYPLHFDNILSHLEYSMFNEIIRNSRNYVLPISDPVEYLIYSTKNYVNSFLSLIGQKQQMLGLVINRVKDPFNLNLNLFKEIFENVYVIRFYREMLFKGFWNVKIPEDIYPIYNRINELL